MQNAPDVADAGLASLFLCPPNREPVRFAPRPRQYYAPIDVSHEMDSVCFKADTRSPRASVSIDGQALSPGEMSPSFPLSVGRNSFTGIVTAEDGITTNTFHFRVFRAFPHPSWKRVTAKAAWVPRDSAGELVFRDRMWILGGYIPAMTNDVWSSADGIEWQREGDVPTTSGIDIPIAFVFDEKMWVSDFSGILYCSADGKTWSIATEHAPWRGRGSAGAVVFNGRIWIMGGAKDGHLLNDVWSSADGITWSLATEHAAWSGRQIHHTPLVLDGYIWLLGGGALGPDYHPFIAWNDVWRSADGIHWEQVLEEAPWQPRIWGSTALYRDRLWLLGGFRAEPVWQNLGDIWYSADGLEWRQLDIPATIHHSNLSNADFNLRENVWAPRHEQSVYTFADTLWLAGGMIWPLLNDVWRLRLDDFCFVSQPPREIYVGARYIYAAHADFHASRQPVNYSLEAAPEWLTIDPATGRLTGIPDATGDKAVCIVASTAAGEVTRQPFTLHVLAMA